MLRLIFPIMSRLIFPFIKIPFMQRKTSAFHLGISTDKSDTLSRVNLCPTETTELSPAGRQEKHIQIIYFSDLLPQTGWTKSAFYQVPSLTIRNTWRMSLQPKWSIAPRLIFSHEDENDPKTRLCDIDIQIELRKCWRQHLHAEKLPEDAPNF